METVSKPFFEIAGPSPSPITSAIEDPAWVRWGLTLAAFGFLGLVLVIPLVSLFVEAFRKGMEVYWGAVTESAAVDAIQLTLSSAGIAVGLNLLFGLAAAWAMGKFRFRGRSFLITLVELPLAVSPVISGLVFVLLFGGRGIFHEYLETLDIKIIFAFPGIALATAFITLPYIARELIPLMQEQENDQEEAALVLGAGGWQTFWRVTLPNIKWGLLYGVLLASARAMGEFGAVSVVSGHIRGKTNTLPLHVEVLYNEYQFAAAFAVASLLILFAVLTVILKAGLEYKNSRTD